MMATEETTAEEIPAEGTPEQTRLAASALHRRERQAYGGTIQWEAAFFGWLAAIGLSALLVAIVVGAGLAVGITELGGTPEEKRETLTVGGGVIIFVILALAYLSGGYVAGRMARFDGWRQGLGVWILALVATAGLALAGLIGGSEYNVLATLDLPRIPVDEGELTTGGAIALGAVLLGTMAASFAGGVAGERFHRAVDRAGVEIVPEPADEAPEEDADGAAEPEAEEEPAETVTTVAEAEATEADQERDRAEGDAAGRE
jgi:ABC-type multidrug transport system fused ATPase/permease subunit